MGPAPSAESFIDCFKDVEDPRKSQSEHPILSILVLSLCGVICGANGPTAIEDFGKARLDFLERLVPFPSGIPSHDTIGRVLGMLDPNALEASFSHWMGEVTTLLEDEVIAVDGKTLRRARNAKDGHSFVHMVSAWASASKVVLGQVKTGKKSNEIVAIPKLLDLLSIKGCIVTIDAMGCQKDIVEQIVDKGADYIIPVKKNQRQLLAEVSAACETALASSLLPQNVSFHETSNEGHGRRESRRCWTLPVPEFFPIRDKWKGLATLVYMQSERTLKDKTSITERWFISSRVSLNAETALSSIRAHWGIENRLHWSLDVAFDEDQSRLRAKNAAENLVVIRHAALNCLRSATNVPGGIARKRLKAGYDSKILAAILKLPNELTC